MITFKSEHGKKGNDRDWTLFNVYVCVCTFKMNQQL